MNGKIHGVCLLLLCTLFTTTFVFSEIRTISSFDEISLHELSTKTLVMFDIDDVLIYPKDALMQNWRKGWKPEGERAWSAEEDTIAWANAKFQIMDPSGPQLIDLLNAQEIPAIGFTAFAMDQAGIVESVPGWRSHQLESLGICFKAEKEIVFSVEEGFVPASFEKGILYCGDFYKKDKNNKGIILSLYLDWLDWKPDLAILIDDGKKNLDSVEKALEARGIPFIGYLYIPKELDPIDERIATLQYKTLVEKQIWLSDSQAHQCLD